jgi:acyl carrier protein
MDTLELDLKRLVISSLALEMAPEDIDTDSPLFGEGLGLDSIDALELGVALKRQYSIPLDGDADDTKARFFSIRTLADLVRTHIDSRQVRSS